MKKKHYLFLLLLTLFFSCENSRTAELENNTIDTQNQLTIDEAKSVLLDFRNSCSQTKSINSVDIKDYKIHNYILPGRKTKSSHEINNSNIQVYEFTTISNQKQGYSLIIGDKRIKKVLMSTEYGLLSDTTFIEPLKLFFHSIPNILNNDLHSFYYDTIYTVSTKSSVTIHTCALPTIWGQKEPYNNKCKVSSCGNRSPAGCVAVAIAQILAYHRLPKKLDWSSILSSPYIKTNSSFSSIEQVSSLIAEIGVSVNMNYGCNSSSADSKVYAKPTLSKYGLKSDMWRNFSWEEIIYSLNRNFPVYLIGRANEGGHAWISDGWKIHEDKYRYLRMNWGWDGSSNGYFYVDNPISFNAGYNFYYGIYTLNNISK